MSRAVNVTYYGTAVQHKMTDGYGPYIKRP